MIASAATRSLAACRRRASRRLEWNEQTRLAELLAKHLDPACTFWTSLENKPMSRLIGLFQKRRGVRSGLPDVLVIFRQKPIFVELKSRSGVATKAQKQLRLELLAAGAVWSMARSARAALMALHLAGVGFRRRWNPPRLHPWEGPFDNPEMRLPQHPAVAAERRAATRRWRARQRARALEAGARSREDGGQRARAAGTWLASEAAS
jgi:hypothetical protein